MTVNRKLMRSEVYKARTIEARYMGPDLLCYVDGVDLGPFYVDVRAAIGGGKRYIDAEEEALAKRSRDGARTK